MEREPQEVEVQGPDAVTLASSTAASADTSALAIQAIQEYVEAERGHTRRVLVWTGTVFLLVVMSVLILFVSIGIFVLRNARRASDLVADAHVKQAAYAAEVVGMTSKLGELESLSSQVSRRVERADSARVVENRIFKTDLERFSHWLIGENDREARDLSAFEIRLRRMEERLREKDRELQTVREQYDALAAAAPGRHSQDKQEARAGLDIPDASVEAMPAPSLAAAEPEPEVPMPAQEEGGGEISVMTFPNGDRYEGQFDKGMFSGWGIYYYGNGDRFEGSFRNDMKNGRGTFAYRNGDKYVGEYKDDMKEGKGVFLFHDGDKYIGDLRNDVINGKGTLVYANANKYVGDFRNGLRHGQGILTFHNGDKYTGDFVDDVRHGRGSYLFADGTKYVGDFKKGGREGEGRCLFPDGAVYVGSFQGGKKHGRGSWIYPDGKQAKGLWKDGEFVRFE